MLQVLSEEEVKRLNDNLVQWVQETLDGDNGTYLSNILNQVKSLMEHMTRKKITWEEQNKLFMDGVHFADAQRKNRIAIKQYNKLNKKK